MRTKNLLVACLLFSGGTIAFSQNIAINTSGSGAASTNMFEVTQTSTAANMVAIYAIHSGATAGTGYGLYSTKTGASTTNIGGYFNASGGTNNYPGIFMGGNVGIGTITPLAKIHVAGGGIAIGNDVSNSISSTEGGRRSIQLASDLSYGGMFNDHTGILMFTTMPGGWTTAKLHIRNSTNWATYSSNDAMTINESTVYIAGNLGITTATPAYRLDLSGGTFGFGLFNQRTETRNNAGLRGDAGAQSGFFQNDGSTVTNYPAGASSWWHLIDCRHSNTANNYALQIAGSFFDQDLYYRKTSDNAAQAWTKILTAANGGVTTSCTTVNYIPKMTSASNIGCSQVFDDGTNVGIGTTAPTRKLSLDASNVYLSFNTSGTEKWLWGNENTVGDRFILFNSSSAGYVMTALTNGNVGIGTTNPLQKLDVQGGNARVNNAFVGDVGHGAAWAGFAHYSQASTSGYAMISSNDGNFTLINKQNTGAGWIGFRVGNADQMVILNGGNVGIGTTNPLYKCHVIGKIKSDGVTETSDLRLKKDVVTINNALSKVEQLRGVYFNWRCSEFKERNLDSTRQIGVIAQEIEKIFPEAVNTDGDGYKSVEYSKLVAVLIEAIKEQQAKIDAQESANKTLLEKYDLMMSALVEKGIISSGLQKEIAVNPK